MKNKKAFYLTNIIVAISILLAVTHLGFFCLSEIKKKHNLKKAKITIYDTLRTYSVKALSENTEYYAHFDYENKNITITKTPPLDYTQPKVVEKIPLPSTLYYTTIFDAKSQNEKTAKITRNGNITPSFSIYIFDTEKIARYRISLYGFEIIRYLKINIYRNTGDRDATFENIEAYHKKWNKTNFFWKEE